MLMEIVNKNYDKLNSTDITVLTYIVEHNGTIADMGIETLAKECFTSKSTVLRLVQKLGFSGYSDFKSYIKWEQENSQIQPDYQDRLDVVQRDIAQTVRGLRGSTDIVGLARAMISSRTIVLFGTGEAQRYCAREMQRSFMEIGVYLFFIGAHEELRMLSQTLGASDLIIFISLSGNTDRLQEVLRIAKVRGIKTASITNLHTNPLAEQCDLNAYAVSSPLVTERGLEHTSFASYFVVFESIFTHYLEIRRQQSEQDRAALE